MNLFLAFVILLNAAALIATGYLLWNLGAIFDKKLADAIRKQDDRVRKRAGSAANGQQESEAPASSTLDQPQHRQAPRGQRPATGRPYRRERDSSPLETEI